MELLLPRVRVITPNLPEARALAAAAATAPRRRLPRRRPASGRDAGDDAAALARALRALGPEVVVVTGGHREQAVDVFFDGSEVVELPGERYPGGAAHGSGCTHSSVLAARLALGGLAAGGGAGGQALAARRCATGWPAWERCRPGQHPGRDIILTCAF